MFSRDSFLITFYAFNILFTTENNKLRLISVAKSIYQTDQCFSKMLQLFLQNIMNTAFSIQSQTFGSLKKTCQFLRSNNSTFFLF